MSSQILLYGASGFTGRLLAAEAARRGLEPVLAGRDATRLAPVAAALGLPWRVIPLSGLDRALSEFSVVLNAAGPFSRTAAPIIDACLATGTHYLDVTGEVDVLDAISKRHVEARQRGIQLMPGVGFDVVPSDCLAAYVAARLPGAIQLDLVVDGLNLASRGSVRTMFEQAGAPTRVRRGGRLTTLPVRLTGPVSCSFPVRGITKPAIPATWGDVVTAFYTTGIPNITTWFTERAGLRGLLGMSQLLGPLWQTPLVRATAERATRSLPEGPGRDERARARLSVTAVARDASGRVVAAEVETPESYSFTAMSGIEIARRVASGDFEAGFHTPARLYGADLILSFKGVLRRDLPIAGAELRHRNADLSVVPT